MGLSKPLEFLRFSEFGTSSKFLVLKDALKISTKRYVVISAIMLSLSLDPHQLLYWHTLEERNGVA